MSFISKRLVRSSKTPISRSAMFVDLALSLSLMFPSSQTFPLSSRAIAPLAMTRSRRGMSWLMTRAPGRASSTILSSAAPSPLSTVSMRIQLRILRSSSFDNEGRSGSLKEAVWAERASSTSFSVRSATKTVSIPSFNERRSMIERWRTGIESASISRRSIMALIVSSTHLPGKGPYLEFSAQVLYYK